jgi:formate dehydrogenase iron-sulfur subunit
VELNRRDFLKVSLGTAGLLFLPPPEEALAKDSTGKPGKAVLVDTSKCVGCWWCYAACKQAHNLPETIKPDPQNPPELQANVWTTLSTSKNNNEWHFAKRQCMHCQFPACVNACPVGALEKTANGPVVYNEHKCIGCRYCMVACPFGVPNFEWEDPTPWIRKCDFCAGRLAEGQEPACVSACPMGALKFGEREDLLTQARERIAAEPGKYIDHIYGENEAGGTSWLYISAIPIENMGFPSLDATPLNLNVSRAMSAVPPVLLGVTVVMAGVHWFVKRRGSIRHEAEARK